VGQIPLETTKEEILNVFSNFGTVKNATLLTTPEGRSKGCAMVLFEKWAQAEFAMNACNGKSFFGTQRTLVVNLADPPRRGGGVPPIAPKTLFVGQVPKTADEEDVRVLFEPYGEIVEFHISRKGSVSGCAFVKFKKWSEAEAAMDALHGRYTLPDAKNPLVVKFADAKNKDPVLTTTELVSPIKTIEPLWQHGTKPLSSVAPFGFNELPSWQQNPTHYMYQNLSRGMGFNMAGASPYLSTAFNNATGAVSSAAYASMLTGMNSSGMMGTPQISDLTSHVSKPVSTLSGKLGPGISDPRANDWKLFVGQVPFECGERDLWPIFSQLGEVLELVILRSEGRSKGCGFVTYADRETAEVAAARLNGHVSLPNDQRGKRLVVRFANKKKEITDWSCGAEECQAE